jgi:hypothetical protein
MRHKSRTLEPYITIQMCRHSTTFRYLARKPAPLRTWFILSFRTTHTHASVLLFVFVYLLKYLLCPDLSEARVWRTFHCRDLNSRSGNLYWATHTKFDTGKHFCGSAVEIGFNDLGLCETSSLTIFTVWSQLLPMFFIPSLCDIRKNICLRYKDITSHRFQYNFPRSKLFWGFNHPIALEMASPLLFEVAI